MVANILGVVALVGINTLVMLLTDVGSFFRQSPAAMALVCILSAAAGYLAHGAVYAFRHSRGKQESGFIDRLHSALKEKGCADFYDISCKESVKALAERLAEVAADASRDRAEGAAMSAVATVETGDGPAKGVEDDWRTHAFGRLLAEPAELSPTAERLLREMTDDEARCLMYLANVAVLRDGRPSDPLVVVPTEGEYETMGVTDELIGSLVEHGLLKREAISVTVYAPGFNPVGGNRGKTVSTRTSSGELSPVFVSGRDLVYPNPPLRFTTDGSEIAAICGVEPYPDAVSSFGMLWLDKFNQQKIPWSQSKTD